MIEPPDIYPGGIGGEVGVQERDHGHVVLLDRDDQAEFVGIE